MLNNEAEALLMETFSDYVETENEAGGTTVTINSRSGESTNVEPRIILVIDEPSRTIQHEKNLILGVVGDRFAERIYFKSPQYVYKDSYVIDLIADTTKIYINYANKNKEPYIEECAKGGLQNDGTFLFSWLITDYATVVQGEVTFNVCVKDESGNFRDINGNILIPEWHTTTAKGNVLPAVDVSEKTPEVITSDTVTSAEIIAAMNDYRAAVEDLEAQLADTDAYIDGRVDEKFAPLTSELNNKIDANSEHLNAKIDETNENLNALNEELENTSSDLAELSSKLGVTYLGTFTTMWFDTSNDYLAEVTTPGVYTFNYKSSTTSLSVYILIVNNVVGNIFQTVLSNLTSQDRFAMTRSKQSGGSTWTDHGTKEFAYKDDLGVKYIGSFNGSYFDTSNDYLSTYTDPGIYSFNKTTNIGTQTYLMVVTETMGRVYQTVFSELTGVSPVYERRYMENDDVWVREWTKTIANTQDLTAKLDKPTLIYEGNTVGYIEGLANRFTYCNIRYMFEIRLASDPFHNISGYITIGTVNEWGDDDVYISQVGGLVLEDGSRISIELYQDYNDEEGTFKNYYFTWHKKDDTNVSQNTSSATYMISRVWRLPAIDGGSIWT